jgi:ElaB/YqjD/DUF883 family membrane-anchored ribosome-binding protein
MNVEHKKNETHKQQVAGDHDGAGADAQSILEHGEEVYGRAEQAVTDVYDKTAQAVGQTYEQVKNYSSENPGKTILVTLGIGFGLGLLLGVSSHRPRTRQFAQPVVNALSDIALALFR